MSNLNEMFDEFNELYGLETKSIDHNLPSMHKLINDECDELKDECATYHVDCQDNVIKEAIDIIYITAQQLRERGVDVDSALSEVHRSNMSKSLSDKSYASEEIEIALKRYPSAKIVGTNFGCVMKCSDTGKVIKPTTYSPAVITPAMWGEK